MSESRLHLGDCRSFLKTLPENSVDSVVTDPPYELGFMGKAWDSSGIAYDVGMWREVLRVLKPGGHLLSFGGTRTYHRMACAIEDAGFEVRDQIQWLYGSGFPKSHNLEGDWDGWGTALKPANEPICVARKPLSEKTVVANVLRWGVGALNINGCRVTGPGWRKTSGETGGGFKSGKFMGIGGDGEPTQKNLTRESSLGRWPANIALDEEVAALLDAQSGQLPSRPSKTMRRGATTGRGLGYHGNENIQEVEGWFSDSGGASRFFYVAKASRSDRGKQNLHPTVKPVELMKHLIKLVTPPGGMVLDPFTGSGSTFVGAIELGFVAIGSEMNPEYYEMARKRVAEACRQTLLPIPA